MIWTKPRFAAAMNRFTDPPAGAAGAPSVGAAIAGAARSGGGAASLTTSAPAKAAGDSSIPADRPMVINTALQTAFTCISSLDYTDQCK